MNRRKFLLKSAMAAFGFSILPGAGRIWRATVPCERLTIAMLDAHFSVIKDNGLWDEGPPPVLWRINPFPLRFYHNPKTGIMELVKSIETEPHYDPNYT